MNSSDPLQLTQLLAKKLQLLVQLRDLGQRQIEFIEDSDLASLLKVLSAKQHILTLLPPIERQLDPFRDQDPERRPWQLPQQRELCARLAQQCEQTLDEIVGQEKRSETDLIQRRDEAAIQLQGTHSASHARNVYSGELSAASGQLDLSSDSFRAAR